MSTERETFLKDMKRDAKGTLTAIYNKRLKECVKGDWLQGYIHVPEYHAKLTDFEYTITPNGMAKINA